MHNLIALRDLPGIRAAEEICWNPHNLEPPHRFDSLTRIYEISRSLFGITIDDTAEPLPGFTEQEWELHFEVCYYEYEVAEPVWTLLGWDVSDGKGDELFSLDHFARQIVATTKGLVPGARLSLEGKAHLANTDAEQQAEAWGEALARDAQLFKRSA